MNPIKHHISFYCDESGTFRTIGNHVICPLIIAGDAVSHSQMAEIWRQVWPQGNWETFHAVNMNKYRLQEIFSVMIDELFARAGVSGACIHHCNASDYGYDFYYNMLLMFFLWYLSGLRRQAAPALIQGGRLNLIFKIYLAERGPLNLVGLEKNLTRHFSQMMREFNQANRLAPDNYIFNVACFTLPAAHSPFIQVSDLLSHLMLGRRNDADLLPTVRQFLDDLKQVAVADADLKGPACKQISDALRGSSIVTVIMDKPLSQAFKPPVADRLEPRFSETLLEKLLGSGTTPEERYARHAPALLKHLANMEPMPQITEAQMIWDAAEALIETDRNYAAGRQVVQFLQTWLQDARRAAVPLPLLLDTLEVQTATLYLAANNHEGHFPLNDLCIADAEGAVLRLQANPAHWPLACRFYNNMAVALQNIFDFEGAHLRLQSLVEHIEGGLKNPFQGAGIYCYEFGALFGTYAQTLAFDAHCAFFQSGLQAGAAGLRETLELAEYYSELAREHFQATDDHDRHITYQAHFQLQGYILTGSAEYLAAAQRLLFADSRTDEAVAAFMGAFPQYHCITPGYRVSAALKYAWLAKAEIPGLAALTASILKHRSALPSVHPLEQILAWLALLTTDRQQQKHLREGLNQLHFPPNIVRTIQLIMQLQVAWHLGEAITPADIQAVADSLTPAIEPQWRRYGLVRVLQAYTRTPDRWHIGPAEVLPFNYS